MLYADIRSFDMRDLNMLRVQSEINPCQMTELSDQGLVVQTCNPSYSRGRGRKMASSRPAWVTDF